MKETVPGRDKKILVMKGNAKYSVTRQFADELIDGFRHHGYRCAVFDARHNTSKDLEMLLSRKYALVFAVNGVFTEKDIPKEMVERLWENTEKAAAFMVDHPCHHRERMSLFRKGTQVTFPDRLHVTYAKQYYKKLTEISFLPHAGCQAGMAFGKRVKDRKKDLVFAGSYYDVKTYASTVEKMEGQTRSFMEACMGELRKYPGKTVEQTMADLLGTKSIDFLEKSNSDILLFLEEYIRTDIRNRVIQAVVEGGQKIHVYGAGWDKFTCSHKENFIWEGEVGFDELSRVLDDTKIFLNIMPWFKDGSHERVFTAMLHGAAVLSDESAFLEENLPEGKEAFYYSLEKLELLAAQIRRILEAPERLESVRMKAFQNTAGNHLWENRAEELLEMVGM